MKKSLLALAVLGAFAGAASAQSSVTLYGVIDTYVESDRIGSATGSATTNTKLSAGGLSGPRWGMRGSEDLGGGNSAIFTLEGGFNSDSGTLGQGGRLFGRQGFVGFSGDWGSLTAGRQYAPIFYTQADSDTDGYSTFSQPAHLSNINGNTLRQDNQVRYTTATLGTFKGMVSYAFGENASNNTSASVCGTPPAGTPGGFGNPGGTIAGRMAGANFTVGVGPVNLVGGYHRENGTTCSNIDTKSIYAVGANATFGAFTPVFNYFSQKTVYDSTFTVATATVVPARPDSTIKGWSVGSSWGMGSWAAQLQYGQVKNDALVPTTTTPNTTAKEKFLLIGGDYIFSKRTNLYLRYAEVKDSNNAPVNGGAPTASDGTGYLGIGGLASNQKDSVIALGVRHRF